MGQPGGRVGAATPRRADLQEALRRHFVVRTLRADECISADWHRAQGHGAALRAAVVMLCTRTGEAAAEALLAAAVGEGGGGEGGGGGGEGEGGGGEGEGGLGGAEHAEPAAAEGTGELPSAPDDSATTTTRNAKRERGS